MKDIKDVLLDNRDETYAEFQRRLIPTADKERIIGVRTPILRRLAKEMIKSGKYRQFISELPHEYFEQDQLHGFIISELKDYSESQTELERFLPYVNNWATCDQMNPKVLAKDRKGLSEKAMAWISSEKPYTVRFGILTLMRYYLDSDFDTEYLKTVCEIQSEEYYVNMMIAWYFATALAKQYDSTLPYITEHRLSEWVHNKTVRKALESYRISEDKKAVLKTIRRR